MRLVSTASVDAYMKQDAITNVLNGSSQAEDEQLTCQRWLREVPAKRYIVQELYGDLLASDRRRVLDVGGGLTSLTHRDGVNAVIASYNMAYDREHRLSGGNRYGNLLREQLTNCTGASNGRRELQSCGQALPNCAGGLPADRLEGRIAVGPAESAGRRH